MVFHALDGEKLGVLNALGLDDFAEGTFALLTDEAVV